MMKMKSYNSLDNNGGFDSNFCKTDNLAKIPFGEITIHEQRHRREDIVVHVLCEVCLKVLPAPFLFKKILRIL